MYTKGITKIFFNYNLHLITFEQIADLAEKSGYEAFSYKGMIYVLIGEKWIQSPFTICDFEVK